MTYGTSDVLLSARDDSYPSLISDWTAVRRQPKRRQLRMRHASSAVKTATLWTAVDKDGKSSAMIVIDNKAKFCTY